MRGGADGASLWTRFWSLTVPLCRPALAALATLLTTWIYNDFFWAITLMSSGDKRPVTSALANLQGQFVSNQNLIAAGAMIAAIPTLVVYILLQKQFIAGLSPRIDQGVSREREWEWVSRGPSEPARSAEQLARRLRCVGGSATTMRAPGPRCDARPSP